MHESIPTVLNDVIVQWGAFGVVAIAFLYLLIVIIPKMQADYALSVQKQGTDFALNLQKQRTEFLEEMRTYNADITTYKTTSWDHVKEERRQARELSDRRHAELSAEIDKLAEAIKLHTAALNAR